MQLKKNSIKIFILLSIIINLNFSDEINLAKFYIQKAHQFYNEKKIELSKEYLSKSFDYCNELPEYYYFYNLVLPETKNYLYKKYENVEIMLKYLNNMFFLEEYDFYSQASRVYEKARDFKKSKTMYNKLISLDNKKKDENDYLSYIKMLFKPKNALYYNEIPIVISKAKKHFISLEYDYYYLKYKILTKKIENNEFNISINKLISNNFSQSKVLFLKAIFFNNRNKIVKVFNEFINLRNLNLIEAGYKKKIIFELLYKSHLLIDKEIFDLLKDWIIIGINDSKTDILLKNKKINNIIQKDKKTYNIFLNYSGVRRKDEDNDGEWEKYVEYNNGNIKNIIYDENQDGIFETKTAYNNDKKVIELIIYKKNNEEFTKYNFNTKDQSLNSIEYFNNNQLAKREVLIKSRYYPKIENLLKLKKNEIKPYIDIIEEWNDSYGYVLSKYYNSKQEYKFIDKNLNGIFEKKFFYKNQVIDEILNDNNENNKNEILEKYEKNKLIYLKFKTNDYLDKFDYIEYYYNDKIIKKWDNNHDNLFEILIEEFNNGNITKRIDIDYDGNYDYLFDIDKNNISKIYLIKDKKKILINKKIIVKEVLNVKQKDKKWNIVSSRNIDNLILPDDIKINNNDSLSGIYYYKDKKYFFDNGIIKNDYFSYRFFIINGIPYLIDIN